MKHRKIKHWDDERDLGNSLILTTAKGWAFEPHRNENVASHVKGFDTVKEARAALKWLKPCECARCLRKDDE